SQSIRAELLREQRERVEPPREVRVADERDHRLTHVRQVSRAQDELVETCDEMPAPVLAPEVDGERLDRTVVDAELAMRVAPGREKEERPPPRLVQLLLGDVDLAAGRVGEDGVRIPELPALEPCEEVSDGVHAPIMARSA